jgi:23S rRNA (uracil1939-C5)-methyltransferase
VNLTIEKLVYGGDGLSRLPEGKTVFTPFVLPTEEVSATIVQEKSSFARATVDQILKPSPYRIAAPCPYFGTCGGCHYQHANELLPVRQCPISSAAINRVLTRVWEMGEAGKVPVGVNEIEFFADHADAKMVLEIYLAQDAPEMREFATALQAKAPEIKGIAFFAESAGVEGGGQLPKYTVGETALPYQVGEKAFRVSAGSFFQVNRYLVKELVQTVVGDFHGKIALDLFAGVGLFAGHLSKRFDQVFAVESAPASAADLQANAVKNVVPVLSPVEGFLPRCLNMQPELVVVDPPRAGLGAKTSQLLAALRVKRIVYVSCDPATLARDARLFLETGYHVEEVHLVDLFPQTFHIESVVRLARG